MSAINLFGWAIAFPAILSAAIFLVFGWAFRRLGIERAERAAAGLAVGLGFIAAHCALAMPGFPPLDVTDRIPWIVGLALLLELAEALSPAPLWSRLENRIIVIALAIGAILGPILETTFETRDGTIWVVGVGILAIFSQVNIDAQSERASTRATAVSRLATLIAAGVTLLASGSLVLGELGFALAAAFGSVAFLTFKSSRAAGGPIVVAAFVALLLDGYIYASLPARVAIALILAPWTCWLGAIPALKRGNDWRATILVVPATLLMLAIAIAWAIAASPDYD